MYLITICVADRRSAFHDWTHARPVVAAMNAEARCGHGKTLAWVLMPDHFHWLVQLGATDVNVLVRRFKSRSTRQYNIISTGRAHSGRRTSMTGRCGQRTM
ncbi:transposase [Pseudomonas sp. RIT-PI-S]|uniref:transposase n=1 Tax=Pseudomonas sp. RIT-PI-S TaxID=3035295 RepID=UPI0032080229